MRHLLRQSAFQMNMIINHGEILLLVADDLVRRLIDRRQRVIRVERIVLQAGYLQIAESHLPGYAPQGNIAVREQPFGVCLNAIGLRRLGVAHHRRIVDSHLDILSPDGDGKLKPLPVFRQRTVEVAHRRETSALPRPVDSAVTEKDFVAARPVGMEEQGGFRVGLGASFSGQNEIGIIFSCQPGRAAFHGQFLAGEGAGIFA